MWLNILGCYIVYLLLYSLFNISLPTINSFTHPEALVVEGSWGACSQNAVWKSLDLAFVIGTRDRWISELSWPRPFGLDHSVSWASLAWQLLFVALVSFVVLWPLSIFSYSHVKLNSGVKMKHFLYSETSNKGHSKRGQSPYPTKDNLKVLGPEHVHYLEVSPHVIVITKSK